MWISFFNNYSALLWAPLAAILLSWVFTRYAINWLCHHGFAAEMGARHIHKRVIPTGGGIAMIAAFVLLMPLVYLRGMLPGYTGQPIPLGYLLPLAVLLPLGLYDDRFGMRAGHKLAGQILAAALAWQLGLRFDMFFFWALPDYISLPLTVFWFLLFINAFNLIDGLDGLAAGLGVVASLSLGTVLLVGDRYSTAIIAFTLAGVCVGFLRYNFHPARVFMGDTGSMFLGYTLGAIGVMTTHKGISFFSMLVPLMACGVPLIDTALAVWRRATFKILSKRSWREIMSADRSHLHHRILDTTNSQSRTAVKIYVVALLLSAVGLIASFINQYLPILAFACVTLALLIVLRKFAIVEMGNSTRLIFTGLARPRKTIFANILHPIYDLVVLAGAIMLATTLFDPHARLSTCYEQWLVTLLPIMLILAFSRTYKVYWLRAGTPDHVRLFNLLTLAFVVDLVIYGAATRYAHRDWDMLVLLPTYLMAIVGIVGERIMLHWAQIILPRYYNDSEFNRESVPTLLFGAGALLSSYQRYINSAAPELPNAKIVGIIDSDPALRGLYIYGYRILGDITDLEPIHERHFFTRIVVITARPQPHELKILRTFCEQHDVSLNFFVIAVQSQPAPGDASCARQNR